MKKWISIVILLNNIPFVLEAQDIGSVARARQILSTHSNPFEVNEESEEAYGMQIKALQYIDANQNPSQGDVLVRYLDYPVNTAALFINPDSIRDKPEDVVYSISEIKQQWPAFAAFLDCPGSSSFLKRYCLNKDNQLKLRITSFLVLRYVDINEFNNIKSDIDKEVIGGAYTPQLRSYVHEIESGATTFWGVDPIIFKK